MGYFEERLGRGRKGGKGLRGDGKVSGRNTEECGGAGTRRKGYDGV